MFDWFRKCRKYIEGINKNCSIESVVMLGLILKLLKNQFLFARKNLKFYSTIGIHPLYANLQNIDSLYRLADNDRVITVSGIGLGNSKDNLNKVAIKIFEKCVANNK